MDIRVHDGHGVRRLDPFVPSLVAVGISGWRTYGGHVPVLPGVENVCVVKEMGTFEKIKSKKLMYAGRHGELPNERFYSATRVDFNYDRLLPMQLDGEFHWLQPEDFPLSIEILTPRIKVLRYAHA